MLITLNSLNPRILHSVRSNSIVIHEGLGAGFSLFSSIGPLCGVRSSTLRIGPRKTSDCYLLPNIFFPKNSTEILCHNQRLWSSFFRRCHITIRIPRDIRYAQLSMLLSAYSFRKRNG